MPAFSSLSISTRLYLTLVLPMVLVAVGVVSVSWHGLQSNAARFAEALEREGMAKEMVTLALTQDDVSKAILLDPNKLFEMSERKLAAYDGHRKIIHDIGEQSSDPKIKELMKRIDTIDAETLRPLDTKILEEMFVDAEAARKRYFEEYEPAHKEYMTAVETLYAHIAHDVEVASVDMQSRNNASVQKIVLALASGIVVTCLAIHILGGRLTQSRKNTQSLLGAMDMGLMFFDKEGNFADERSDALTDILPGTDRMSTMTEVAEHFTEVDGTNVAFALDCLWPQEDDGFYSDFESSVSILPSRASIEVDGEPRHITFAYKGDYNDNGDLEKVFLIVRDVTTELEMQAAAAAERAKAKCLAMASSNTAAFIGFRRESSKVFEDAIEAAQKGAADPAVVADLNRHLHTAKGNLGLWGFTHVAGRIHDLEEEVLGGVLESDAAAFAERVTGCYDDWTEVCEEIADTLGLNQDVDVLKVAESKVTALFGAARSRGDQDLLAQLEALYRHPLGSVLDRYAELIRSLGERRAKGSVNVQFAGDAEVTHDEIQQLDGALIHLVRNCVDHGLETPADRLDQGKPENGTITFSATRDSDRLVLELSDDGGGIDTGRLVDKAIERGLWTPEQASSAHHEEKLNLIFAASLSTKDEVSDVSGRGVGMDAVKQSIADLGGFIHVASERGRGTTFRIEVPTATRAEPESVS